MDTIICTYSKHQIRLSEPKPGNWHLRVWAKEKEKIPEEWYPTKTGLVLYSSQIQPVIIALTELQKTLQARGK